MRKPVLHHVEERALVAQALLRKEFIELTRFVERNFSFGPCLGLADVVAIASDGIDEESPDIVYDGGRVKFRIFSDVLVHVAYVETFACAHELAEERIAAFRNRRIIARPRRARLSQVQRVVLFCSGKVHGIATDKEQVLYGDDSIRDEVHERDSVNE